MNDVIELIPECEVCNRLPDCHVLVWCSEHEPTLDMCWDCAYRHYSDYPESEHFIGSMRILGSWEPVLPRILIDFHADGHMRR